MTFQEWWEKNAKIVEHLGLTGVAAEHLETIFKDAFAEGYNEGQADGYEAGYFETYG